VPSEPSATERDEPDQVRRPAPIVTDDSAMFWEAAREGRLVAQRCGACATLRHPPRPMCPRCHSLTIEVAELSGNGTVYSYAILHHPQNPAFEYPVLGVLVDLDEGIRVMSNIVGVHKDDVRVGMRVEVSFVPTGNDGSVPVFRPSSGAA
jgi:uncharacterized protein